MALEKFDMQKLTTLDGGRLKIAWDQLVARMNADCRDRPGMKTARKVALVMEMRPVMDDEGEFDSVDVTFDVKETIPKRSSRTFNMAATVGGLFVNEVSPDDVKQSTLDEITPRALDEPESGDQEPAPQREPAAS